MAMREVESPAEGVKDSGQTDSQLKAERYKVRMKGIAYVYN